VGEINFRETIKKVDRNQTPTYIRKAAANPRDKPTTNNLSNKGLILGARRSLKTYKKIDRKRWVFDIEAKSPGTRGEKSRVDPNKPKDGFRGTWSINS
jgi:hypothetical protein